MITTPRSSAGRLAALILVAVVSPVTFAAGPRALSLGGQLFNPNGTPVLGSNVRFKVEVRDAADTCVLYTENHGSQNLSLTAGRFNIVLGAGTGGINNLSNSGVLDPAVFANKGVTNVANCASPTVILNDGDIRLVRLSYDLGAGFVAFDASIPIVSSAYAVVAESLNGRTESDFIQVATSGSAALTQSNTEYAFSGLNWPRLKALLDGTSNQYLPTTPSAPINFNGQRAINVAAPTLGTDAANKSYVDANFGGRPLDVTAVGPMVGDGSTLLWDATANKWVTGSVNTTPTGTAGGALTGTYPNPQLANDVITSSKINSGGIAVNRLVITDATTGANLEYAQCANLGEVHSWTATGWMCTSVSSLSPVTSVAGKGGDVILNAADIGGLGTAATRDHGTAAGQVPLLDAGARLPAVDGSLLSNVNAVRLQTRDVASAPPTPGQALVWNGSAWTPSAVGVGSVTSVTATTGLLGGTITTVGTVSVDVGTSANKILQLNASAQVPAVDGSLLTSVNAIKLQSREVSSSAPAAGQVLAFNATTSQWMPTTASMGSVTNVAGGVGLTGGPITSNGTLNVDVGTAANKIVQLNASAQLPAVDGSLLTAVNAVKLQSRAVSSVAPGAGQTLAFNASLSQWEPSTAAAGSVVNVAGGVGILGGPVTSSGTLSVDVGTSANKILQLNAGAQIPAVDGSLLTQINAVKLQARTVSGTLPAHGQALAFNATLTQWEPTAVGVGSVLNVAGGTGILGGPITSAGTLSVDVGTGANKILQLNASAQIPAVDGSLLTSVNATKLQSRAVSSAAPTGGQTLAFNAALSQWEPSTGASGSVTNVAGGTGILGGPITTNGTLSVDVGTGANKILQLNSSAQIPAVDGSLLIQINAVKLQARTVSSALPANGQALAFNATLTQWEPTAVGVGSVVNVTGGTGILGGPITSAGTLSVDVGTGANKILQLNASAQIPAVDGSLLAQVNAVKLQSRAVSGVAPAAGQTLAFNAALSQWEPSTAASGSVTNVAGGTGILGGPITTNGTLSVDVGTGANKILQLNGSAQVPAVDGSLLTQVNAVKLQTRSVSSVSPAHGQALAFNATLSHWEPTAVGIGSVVNVAGGTGILGGPITSAGTLSVDVGTGANKILQLNASAQIPAVDGSLLTQVNAVKLQARAVSSNAPTAGQTLAFNATSSQWEPSTAASGSVTNVAGGTGILGGPITSNGTLSVDVGTGANKILQLNSSAQIPAVDGSLLTQINAVKLQSRAVSSAAPGAGQTLAFNAALSQWEPATAAGGSVTNVAGGTGILGGPITTNGTLSVDVGTGANKILQLNASAQIPAVDGSLLIQINAVKLQSRTISSASPTAGQTLAFNATLSQWEPATGALGSVTNVAGGTGILGGPITTNGTLSVDVGTGANKVLQLNVSAQIPAVDGSLLTQVNAAKLQSRAISNASPTGGQTLAFNAALSQWEPAAAASGSVTNVAGGTGILGGPITTNGTLSVDVGTGANKILQLNASAQIPAVDGSLLTQINAVRLQARAVSNALPANGQALAFNSTLTQWEPTAVGVGSVVNVAGGTGILGGPITSAGTLSVDVGTGANKILQLNASAQIPAVDGSLLAQVNAVKLQSRAVSNALPTAGQTLAFNSTLTQWEPSTAASGSVTNVAGGIGILGGPITTNGTLSVDVGTGANKILQLNASAQIPAVDGSLLTQVNAVKLQTRAVSSANPTAGQVLGWNVTSTTWEPTTGAAGSVVNVGAGLGLLGGPITTNGTLSVDVGTGANKILQLNASAQIPAVDGSLLTSVNAVKLQSRAVSSATPTNGQTLAFNTALSQWEPSVASVGSVTNVAGGTGILGGPITSNGTLSVDVGTTANKILQLNAGGQVPAVDGSLLTFVNAVKLQTRAVSSVNPASGQVLGWNGATSAWEPSTGAAGSVVNVAGGVGIIGGPITSSGTLSVDVGSAANKIVQENGNAQIAQTLGTAVLPAYTFAGNTNTGFYSPGASQLALTANGTAALIVAASGNVGLGTATPAQTLDVIGNIKSTNSELGSSGAYQAFNLYYNGGWRYRAADYGYIIRHAGSGLAFDTAASGAAGAGSIPSTAMTLSNAGNLGIGTNAPQGILDLFATGTTSAMILPRDTTANRPAGVNGMLRYNNTLSQMEGYIAGAWSALSSGSSAGSVTNVAGGVGILGGPITSSGTLSVDVGSAALKIVQENANAQIAQTLGSQTAPSYTFAGDTDTGIMSPFANNVALVSNGTATLFVNDGYVGIGTAYPAAHLDISGSRPGPMYAAINQYGTGPSLMQINTNGGGIPYLQMNQKRAGNSASAANDSLGTIQGQGYDGSNTNGAASISFVAETTYSVGNTPSAMSFITSPPTGSGVERIRITSNGNVGFGTATPRGILELAAVGSSSALVLPRDTTANRPTGVNGMLRYNNTLNQMEGYIGGAWSALSSGSAAGTVTNVAGGVGILGGPITTNGTLSVDVGSAANKIVQENANAQIAQTLGSTALPAYSFAGDLNTGVFSPGADQLSMVTNGAAALRINAAGLVGIGATPYTTLTVGANGAANNMIAQDSTSGGSSFLQTSNGGNNVIQQQSSAAAGAVSLNNTFVGSIKANGFDGTSYQPATNIVSALDGTPAAGSMPGRLMFQTSPDGSVSPVTRVRIDNQGRVAIGPGLPQAGLDVATSGTIGSAIIVPRDTTANRPAGVNGMLRYNNSLNQMEGYIGGAWSALSSGSSVGTVTNVAGGVGILGGPITTNGTLSVDVGTNANQIVQLNGGAQVAPSRGTAALPSYAFAGNTNTGFFSPGANQVALSTNGTAALNVLASGFVGIRTTAPGVALDVNGTIRSTTTTYPNVQLNSANRLAFGETTVPPFEAGSVVQFGSGSSTRNMLFAFTKTGAHTSFLGDDGTQTVFGTEGAVPFTFRGNLNYGAASVLGSGLELMRLTAVGNLGLGTTIPQAALDIASLGTSSAILVPRDTTANRPVGVNGMLRYNTSSNAMEGYIAGAWSTLSSGSGVGTVTSVAGGVGILGGPITTSGTLSVDVGSAANKIVQENATAQIAQTSGSLTNPAYAFAGDLRTGAYSPTTGSLALVTNGTAALTAVNGNVTVNTVTAGTWNGNIVGVPYGGTGASTLTSHGVLIGAGSGPVVATAVGGANSVLVGVAGADPTFSSSPSVLNLIVSGTTSGAVTLAAPDAVTSYTMTLPPTVASVAGQVLTSDTAGVLSWQTPSSSAAAFTGVLPVANGGTGQSTTTQNFVFAGPTAGNGAPNFRALVAGDLPTTAALTTGNSVTSAINLGSTNGQALNLITNNATRLSIDTSGNTALTTTASGPQLTISNTSNRAIVQADTYTNATTASYFTRRKGRGLSSTFPTTLASNDILGAFAGKGYGGAVSSWTDVSYYDVGIEYRTSEAFSTTNHGTKMNFWTTPIGGTAKMNRAVLTDGGLFSVNNPLPVAVLTAAANSVLNNGLATQFSAGLPNAENRAGWFQNNPSHTANLNLDESGLLMQNFPSFAGGTTNAGSATGANIQSVRNGFASSPDSGSLQSLLGQQILFGHSNANGSNSPATTLARGLFVQPVVQSGSIGTAYDLHIAPAVISGTGSLATHFALFAETSAPSVFFGSVGIGIGGATPASALQVGGTITPGTDANFDLGTSGLRFRNIYASNSVINTSDERQKRDVRATDLGLAFVNKLRPVSYYWKTGDDADVHYGLIAQEAARALAEERVEGNGTGATGIVAYDRAADRYGLRYSELIAPIVKAVQELYATLVGQRADLDRLKVENERLRQRNDALERRMDRLERAMSSTPTSDR